MVRSFHDLVMWSLGSTSRVIVFSARILTKICIHLLGEEQGEVLTLFECCSCLKLFPGEDETLLIPPRDAFFVSNLFFDTVAWFNLKRHGLSSLGLHEELHDASKLVLFFTKSTAQTFSVQRQKTNGVEGKGRYSAVVMADGRGIFCFAILLHFPAVSPLHNTLF